MEMKFYRCNHCGNMIAFVKDSGVPVICCGEAMQEIKPNTVDAAKEKHVPVVHADGCKVTVSVGSVPHPMTEAHLIEWIAIETDRGNQRKCLTPTDRPEATFCLSDGETVKAVYAYCNLHGLWMA